LNGYPAKPTLQTASVGGAVAAPSGAQTPVAPAKFSQLCSACHAVGGTGGNVGPALDGIGSRLDADYLDRWLADPQALKPGTAMPKLPLTDAERAELVEFLSAMK